MGGALTDGRNVRSEVGDFRLPRYHARRSLGSGLLRKLMRGGQKAFYINSPWDTSFTALYGVKGIKK